MEALSLAARYRGRDDFEVVALDQWAPARSIESRGQPSGQVADTLAAALDADAATQARAQGAIARIVVEIDRAFSRQLDMILHHPRFQQLEASWRGLRYLVETEAEYDEELAVKVKLLNVSWAELSRDLDRALEFDQSQIFRRLYSDEFDTPGGEPFGVVLGDYAVSHRQHYRGASSVDTLHALGEVGNAALCPIIIGAAPGLFGVDALSELPQPLKLDSLFQQQEYAAWRMLRGAQASRFLGIAVPRVLIREPYRDDGTRAEGFSYREDVTASRENFLWGSPGYAFGSILIRAFANTGWFADIRGGVHAFGEGGVVPHLTYASFDFDRSDAARRAATELQIDDFAERELADFGFIALCSRHGASRALFFSNSSLHQSLGHSTDHSSENAKANARLAGMIQYMLCVSRFGHYLKMIGRDKIGSFTQAEECQRLLQNWLNQYVTASEGASAELKARYPLASGQIEITELPGRPGYFSCVVHLQPHFQLDQLVSTIRLVTELAVGTVAAGA